MSFDVNKTFDMVNQYIDEVNLLLETSYTKGKHEKRCFDYFVVP